MNHSNFYCTNHFALAAILTLVYPLERIDDRSLSGVQFVFRRDASLEALVAQYWQRELRIEPQTYYQQLQRLQQRVWMDTP
jgi:hypothetical protein